MSCEDIKLELPAKAEYTTSLRLLASGIASRAGFDVDTMEDIKLVVSEMLVMAIKDDFEKFVTHIRLCDKYLSIFSLVEEDQKDDLSIKIMEALCDELEIQEDSVCVKFKRGA